ncbi:hypothetical protein KCP75_09285 [Salmonella enterica subsp. enterica]|nr:hypothetical protein KCP75_09285 [Salmonella enterica subsp. enterica]
MLADCDFSRAPEFTITSGKAGHRCEERAANLMTRQQVSDLTPRAVNLLYAATSG